MNGGSREPAHGTNPATITRAIVAALLVVVADQASAADIDIGEQAGEVIGEIAEVTRSFKLSDLPANLEIEADAMSFDYERGTLGYTGNVVVHHGDVRMRADRLRLSFLTGSEKKLQQIEAEGNVEVLRGSERATGRTATYDPEREVITLTGKASLGSGGNTIGGESVVVYLAERRAEVKGKNEQTGAPGRVRAVIDPNSLDLLGEPKPR
jgi:lipopolysaccharide export system protein LptA